MEDEAITSEPELRIFESTPYDLSRSDEAVEAAELALAVVEFLQKHGPLLAASAEDDVEGGEDDTGDGEDDAGDGEDDAGDGEDDAGDGEDDAGDKEDDAEDGEDDAGDGDGAENTSGEGLPTPLPEEQEDIPEGIDGENEDFDQGLAEDMSDNEKGLEEEGVLQDSVSHNEAQDNEGLSVDRSDYEEDRSLEDGSLAGDSADDAEALEEDMVDDEGALEGDQSDDEQAESGIDEEDQKLEYDSGEEGEAEDGLEEEMADVEISQDDGPVSDVGDVLLEGSLHEDADTDIDSQLEALPTPSVDEGEETGSNHEASIYDEDQYTPEESPIEDGHPDGETADDDYRSGGYDDDTFRDDLSNDASQAEMDESSGGEDGRARYAESNPSEAADSSGEITPRDDAEGDLEDFSQAEADAASYLGDDAYPDDFDGEENSQDRNFGADVPGEGAQTWEGDDFAEDTGMDNMQRASDGEPFADGAESEIDDDEPRDQDLDAMYAAGEASPALSSEEVNDHRWEDEAEDIAETTSNTAAAEEDPERGTLPENTMAMSQPESMENPTQHPPKQAELPTQEFQFQFDTPDQDTVDDPENDQRQSEEAAFVANADYDQDYPDQQGVQEQVDEEISYGADSPGYAFDAETGQYYPVDEGGEGGEGFQGYDYQEQDPDLDQELELEPEPEPEPDSQAYFAAEGEEAVRGGGSLYDGQGYASQYDDVERERQRRDDDDGYPGPHVIGGAMGGAAGGTGHQQVAAVGNFI
jgi:hypothetical protein